ncbi:MAG: protein BatD [Anaerolineae bacterium]|nr:protein BatD [Anaerolineae bacterium]
MLAHHHCPRYKQGEVDHTPADHYSWIALRTICLVIILFVGAGAGDYVVLAQSPIMVQVDRTTLSTDEELLLTVTVTSELVNIPQPDLSGLVDFAVINSGSSTQISIINGKMTSQGIYRYHLQPLKAGNLVIPSLSVTIDGQTYQTESIHIKVTPGLNPTLPGTPPATIEAPTSLVGQPVFVEAEVDNPTPYLGQQITYIFRFYQAADASLPTFSRPDYQPPSFTNFWGSTVLAQPYYSTTINGQNYFVTEVHTALFPANPGPLTIEPAKLVIPGDLFNPDIALETEPLTIEVQSLPEGAPPDFSGAVGQFEIQAHLSETEGQVDEPLTLFIDIEGTGNVEVLTEPPLPELPNWRIFDSQSSSSLEVREEEVYGRRRFERLIVPGHPGDYEFPPISFSYYDPQAGEYRTIKTEPIPLTIYPNDATFSSPLVVLGSDKQPITLTTGDIRHIKPVPTILESAGGLLLHQPLYWAFWILPVLIVGGVWFWQNRRQRLALDTAYARSQRARRTAQKILAGAGQTGADGYAAAQRALLGYLADKLNRPTVGLTNDELINLLHQYQLDPSLLEQVKAVLTQVEAGRFAPIEETVVQSLLTETQRLINNLEKSFSRRR